MTDYRVWYQLAVESIDVPASHLHILCVYPEELNLFLLFMNDLMDEELPLHVDELTVCYPCDDLVDKHFLALFEYYRCPFSNPQASFLNCLP